MLQPGSHLHTYRRLGARSPGAARGATAAVCGGACVGFCASAGTCAGISVPGDRGQAGAMA